MSVSHPNSFYKQTCSYGDIQYISDEYVWNGLYAENMTDK